MDTEQTEPENELTETPAGDKVIAVQEAPFVIDTEERANWYLRKVANLEAEKARIKSQAAAMIAQVEADAARLEYRFASQLEAFARQELEKRGGRRKSLTLFQGTLSFRSQGPRLSVGDVSSDAALTCAAGWQATRPTIDRAAYLAAAERIFADTGELLPGIERSEAKESFSVSFGKSKGEAETPD